MKNKLLCSIAVTLMASNGFANEPQIENNAPIGETFQTLDGLNAINYSPNAMDMKLEKGFGSGIYYLFIAPSSGSVNHSTLDYTYGGAGCMYTSSSHTDGDFDVNLQLPDGHSINGFRYFWNDTDTGFSTARLWKFNGAGGVIDLLSISSTGDTGFGSAFDTVVNYPHVIDNTTGSYVIRFTGSGSGSTQEICGVRLAIVAP